MPASPQPRPGATDPEPSGAFTEFVSALYADVLARGSVGPDDDFFADLNGNSLGAAEVIVTVERIFGVRVLDAFFVDSTSSAVAREIEEQLRVDGFDAGRAREAVSAGSAVAARLSALVESLEGVEPGSGAPTPADAA
jgi:acyl carrier protein